MSSPDTNHERRSAMFDIAGATLIAGIFAAFAVFLARYYVQSTHWKNFFYKDAYVFSDLCGARFTGSDSADFPASLSDQPVRAIDQLPHPRGFFNDWRGPSASKHYHAEYRCVIPGGDLRIGRGANYMHLGWLFGDRISIDINSRRVLDLHGEDFVSFPLSYEDLTQPEIILTVRVSAADGHRFGFASLLPPAITAETKAHLSIFAVQPVFELNNTVLPGVATLCLGLLLAFAWILGIRTRMMLTGMFYFVAELFHGTLMLLGPYLPVGATKVHTLVLPLSYLAQLAAFCLLLEVLGVWRTKIYSVLNLGLTFCAFSLICLIAWDGVFPYSQNISAMLDGLGLSVMFVLFCIGVRLRRVEADRYRRRLMTATLILCLALIYRYGHELSRHLDWYGYFNISFYYKMALPMYLTGLVLYHLSTIERELRRTSRERDALSRRLGVSSDLLSIVRSSVSLDETVKTGVAEIKCSAAIDGVWRAVWECDSGATILMHGQIFGGEEQAGLGMTALTSAVIGWQEGRPESPAACIESLNRILYVLFRGYVRSSVIALRIERDGMVDVWSAGGEDAAPIVAWDGCQADLGPSGGPIGAAPHCRPAHIRKRLTPGARISIEFSDGRMSSNLHQITLVA